MKKQNIFKVLTLTTAMLLLVGCKDVQKIADKKENLTTEVVQAEQVEQGSVQTWSIDKYPNYYTVVGKSGINPSDFPKAGKIQYGELDKLGRTTEAKGSLTFKNVEGSYGVRQKFSKDADPSGWGVQDKVKIPYSNGKQYKGYFWNRSHLIGDALGGDAIRQNVVTGTRTQNVGEDAKGGMRYSEIKAQEWLEANHDGTLYYGAKPVYEGNELVPRYVEVSMKSSDGTIDEKVIVFNSANGFEINYADGTFKAIK